jgi:hypothetical protein
LVENGKKTRRERRSKMNKDKGDNTGPPGESDLKQFIDGLDSIDALEGPDPDRKYIDHLIKEYGLPSDEASREVLVTIRREMRGIRKKLPEPLFSYLKIFLYDIMVNSEEHFTTVFLAFLCGIAFEETVKTK